MQKFWELYPQGLPADYCDQLLARAEELPAQDGTIGSGADAMPDVRRSTVRWLDVDGLDFRFAQDIMFFARKANRASYGFDIVGVEAAQLTEYHATENGKYDWHQDVSWGNPAMYGRKLSYVAQLSDPSEYEGGDFEFFRLPSPGADFKQRGAVLVFPSFLLHRVTPVTAGVRRSFVAWIEGPKFR